MFKLGETLDVHGENKSVRFSNVFERTLSKAAFILITNTVKEDKDKCKYNLK